MGVYVLPLGRSAVAPVCLVRPGTLRLVPLVQPERGESLLTSAAIAQHRPPRQERVRLADRLRRHVKRHAQTIGLDARSERQAVG